MLFAFLKNFYHVDCMNIVYVMATILLKAKNLYEIIKLVITALKEIGFRVKSLITDNNMIN